MPNTQKIESKDTILTDNINKSIQFSLYEDQIKGDYETDELKDREVVDEIIDKMYADGCRPIISVEPQYVEEIKKKGMKASETWDKGYKMDIKSQQIHATRSEGRIRGTFGIQPYESDKRTMFLASIPRSYIAPVYTGKNNTFNGVVQISGAGIKPESLFEIEKIEEDTKLSTVENVRELAGNIIESERMPDAKQFHAFADRVHTEEELTEVEETEGLIDELYEKGIRPVIALNDIAANEALRSGIEPEVEMSGFKRHEKSQQVVATKSSQRLTCSFGREPAKIGKRKGERLLLLDVPRNKIKPIFGGPGKYFDGVVNVSISVDHKDIIELEPDTNKLRLVQEESETNSEQQTSV